jgi:hypothetical protein
VTAILFYCTSLVPASFTLLCVCVCLKARTPNFCLISRGHRCAKKKWLLSLLFLTTFASSEEKKLSHFPQSFGMYLDIISTYSPSFDVASFILNYRRSRAARSSVLHSKLLVCKFSSVRNLFGHTVAQLAEALCY